MDANYLSAPLFEGNIFVDNYYIYRKYENIFTKELDEAGVLQEYATLSGLTYSPYEKDYFIRLMARLYDLNIQSLL